MKAVPIEIAWHPALPIFASEPFLRAVSQKYGWLGGMDESGRLRCILPYTILGKAFLRLVRFRVETIALDPAFSADDERSFLNSAMDHFRSLGADAVIPATTNAIFRTFPDGADAAPYGSYVIDLTETEEQLWRNVERITRQNINTARKNGVGIRIGGPEDLGAAYALMRETFGRSRLPFMGHEEFMRYVAGLGEYGRLLVAERNGIVQSCVLFAFSEYCAYAVYAGNLEDQSQGANKLLYWDAVCMFRRQGIRRYDFVGARIDPARGSKQEAINSLKRRFGAKLTKGYMWKYSIHPLRYRFYCLAARVRSRGDIVDQERHKLAGNADER